MIQWDSLIVEMLILAAIIYFSVYLEHWTYRRSERQKEDKTRKQLFIFIENDLKQRLRFIDESQQLRIISHFLLICGMPLFLQENT
ncbi:MAG: hypothetical protein WBP84_09990, partial [Nitrososphaeraceae archaeon]